MADGTLKVGTITTSSGSGTITLGQSGETITVPSGVTMSGMGKVLQVVSNVNTYGSQSTTSTSYVDMQTTGGVTWEVSITPSSTSNKILAIFSSQLMGTGNAQEQRNKCRLMEKIGAGSYAELTYKMQGGYNGGGATSIQPNDNVHLMYLSSPSSTDTISYKLQILTQSSSVTLIPNHNSYSTAVLMEIVG